MTMAACTCETTGICVPCQVQRDRARLIYCECGDLAIALIGSHERPVCLDHYIEVLDEGHMSTAQGQRVWVPIESVTTGGVL